MEEDVSHAIGDRVYAAVRQAIARFSLGASLPLRPTSYAQHGRRLVRTADSNALPDGRRIVSMPVAASEILIRNSAVRIMNPESMPGLSVKVCLSSALWQHDRGMTRSNLFRSIHGARLAAALNPPFTVVAPIRHDRRGMWFVEPLVNGPTLASRSLPDFIPVLSEFHRRTRRSRPISVLPRAMRLMADLQRRFPAVNRGGDLVDTAFIHDDMFEENILNGADGKLAVIDWDTSGVKPVAYDLAAMCHRHRDAIPACVRALEDTSSSRSISPRIQLALGLMHRTDVLRADDARWEKSVRGEYGFDPETVAGLKREHAADVWQMVAELLHP